MAEGNRRLDLQPFRVDCSDHIATGEAWSDWLDDFERQLRYFRITEDDDKTDALLIYGGPEVKRLSRSLEDPEKSTKYEKLSSKLSDYFSPKKNTHYCRYLFFKMRPNSGECTIEYAARLRDKALTCNFVDIDDRILEHLVQTTSNSEFVRKVLHKKWTLQEALSDVQIIENTSIQLEEMNHKALEIDRIRRKKKEYNTSVDTFSSSDNKHRYRKSKRRVCQDRHTTGRRERSNRRINDYTDSETSSSSEEESREFIHAVKKRTKLHLQRQKIAKTNYAPCGYCGRNQVHARKEHCIAYGKRCYSCNKWHHIAKVCKNKMQRRGTRQRTINDFSSSDESVHSLTPRSSLTPSVQHISKCYDLIENGFTVDESEAVCAFQETGVSL